VRVKRSGRGEFFTRHILTNLEDIVRKKSYMPLPPPMRPTCSNSFADEHHLGVDGQSCDEIRTSIVECWDGPLDSKFLALFESVDILGRISGVISFDEEMKFTTKVGRRNRGVRADDWFPLGINESIWVIV
jgi:hypothetical protein